MICVNGLRLSGQWLSIDALFGRREEAALRLGCWGDADVWSPSTFLKAFRRSSSGTLRPCRFAASSINAFSVASTLTCRAMLRLRFSDPLRFVIGHPF